MDFRVKIPGPEKQEKLRMLPQSGQGFGRLAERAPQARAFAAEIATRAAERLRPSLTLLYALRRRLATGGVVLLTVWLFAHVMFGANGMVVYKQKKAEYQSLQNEIDALQKENDHYTAQVKSLQTDPKTIEKEAREQLHYARPGEVIYVAPPPLPAERPSTDAARQ